MSDLAQQALLEMAAESAREIADERDARYALSQRVISLEQKLEALIKAVKEIGVSKGGSGNGETRELHIHIDDRDGNERIEDVTVRY